MERQLPNGSYRETSFSTVAPTVTTVAEAGEVWQMVPAGVTRTLHVPTSVIT
jgi:hypothetical protein